VTVSSPSTSAHSLWYHTIGQCSQDKTGSFSRRCASDVARNACLMAVEANQNFRNICSNDIGLSSNIMCSGGGEGGGGRY
jgi:hypothetical protein